VRCLVGAVVFSAFYGRLCPLNHHFYALILPETKQFMATKTIVIDGPIGQYSFSKQFMRNELAGQSKNPVLIKITSLGGSVDDALNIYDQFIEHGNVTAELSAFVASSATLISLGAKTVRMNENSFYLIHKAMNWVDEWGSMNEDEIDALIAKLETQKQQLAKVTLQLAKMYVQKTGYFAVSAATMMILLSSPASADSPHASKPAPCPSTQKPNNGGGIWKKKN
jgi:ATP-dependent protease ClpP protease subunit